MKQLELFGALAREERLRLPDGGERLRVRTELGTTLFVEAAAGTGKTTELVRRVVAVLVSGLTTLGRMVALTFTDKAAGELKLRLREEIEREREAARDAQVQERLDSALAELEAAQIGTIHSFCAALLREWPVEARVDPLFTVAAEEETQLLLDDAFESWFRPMLDDPPEGVRRLLHRRPSGPVRTGPRELLREAALRLLEHRDFSAPWSRRPIDREAAIDDVMRRMQDLAAIASQASYPDDYLARSLRELSTFCREQQLLEVTRPRDYDRLEARLRELHRHRLWHWNGQPGRMQTAPGYSREQVLVLRSSVQTQLSTLLETTDADLAALLQSELQSVIVAYERLKAQRGMLDFLDLLVRTRDLVREHLTVRVALQQRYTHFLVDEFQDTDPLQVELLWLLAAQDPSQTDWTRVRIVPGKLFLVGDPKQSIYRFRRADVSLYETAKAQLQQQGAELVALDASFRSTPALQQAINAAFAPLMDGDREPGQARYVPLRPVRRPIAEQPSVVALPVPRPYASGGWRSRVTSSAIESSCPDAVGAFIAWLVRESGWTVTERERADERVPVESRHVCLLFRRFTGYAGEDMTRPYVRALEARHLPHVVVGGRAFHRREEILALCNALRAIEWPDDELSVFATLRGPLFALTDDQLLAFRARAGHFHPLQAVDISQLAGPEREIQAGLALLGRLHLGRNRRPVASTLTQLLESVRAHAGLALWPTGEQVLANALHLIELAQRCAARGATSFRAFIHHLSIAAERGGAQEAPVVEEGTEGVRMMTVHRAKGLEFPVVVLVDPTARHARRAPSRHVVAERGLWAEPLAGCSPYELTQRAELELRRDEQEEVRLVYVGATRARELLVVPVIGDLGAHYEGWLSVLNPALYPPAARAREMRLAPGCPAFGGSETVLDRPASAEAEPGSSVAPGLHQPAVGEHEVVWWDPAALELNVEHQFGPRQQRLMQLAESATPSEHVRREYQRWRALRQATRARGAEPLLAVASVTALARGEQPSRAKPDPVLEVVRVDGERTERPGGARFGALVHAALAQVGLPAAERAIRDLLLVQGRMLGAPAEEVNAAYEIVRAALQHPLLQRAAASDELRREVPVLLRRGEGSLAEGIIDLAFREGTRWTVVDFKTDRDLESQFAEYRAQVRWYVDAVAASTAQETRGVLLVL